MRFLGVLAIAVVACSAAAVAVAGPLMSRSQAAKIARTSNLRASDVTGYKSTTSTQARGEDIWGGRSYARCANRKAYGKDIADVMSPSFERSGEGQYDALGSEVEVMPKQALAANDITIAKSKLGQRCMKREMLRFKPRNLNLDGFSAKRLTGFNNGVAYRIKMTVTSNGTTFPIYADVFAFAEREVEGAVFFISGPDAPQRGTENNLVNKVLTRIDGQVYKNEIF